MTVPWHSRLICFASFALILPGVTGCVFGADYQTKWSGLAGMIAGKRVSIILNSSGTVDGDVVSVTSTGLRMNVVRSNDPHFAARMEHAIPRFAIARLQLIERGVAGRIIGGAAGAVGGFLIAGTIFDKPGEIPVAQASIGAVAGTVGGYLIGSRLDHRRTTIRLLPD